MPSLQKTVSPQDLALHNSGELIPASHEIVARDIKSGRIVMPHSPGLYDRTQQTAEEIAQTLASKESQ